MVRESDHRNFHFPKPFFYPKPTSAVRKNSRPLRDGTTALAGSFLGGKNRATREKIIRSHESFFDGYGREKKELFDLKTRGKSEITSFYVTNFPENWRAKDLSDLFARFGKVVDVVIPGKRNRNGWRFAFARFSDCDDKFELERVLDNLWVGSFKLRINLPRFSRGTQREAVERNTTHIITKSAHTIKNVSYADITRKGPSLRGVTQNKQDEKDGVAQGNSMVLQYIDREEDCEWLKGAIVGNAKFYDDWIKALWEAKEIGFDSISISPLSGGLWLVFDEGRNNLDKFLDEAKEWLNDWFDDWHPWKHTDGISQRYIWVQIFGIPLHLWNKSFFQWIVKSLGQLVEVDSITESRRRLDIARLKILSPCFNSISREVVVSSRSSRFVIHIREEESNFSEWMKMCDDMFELSVGKNRKSDAGSSSDSESFGLQDSDGSCVPESVFSGVPEREDGQLDDGEDNSLIAERSRINKDWLELQKNIQDTCGLNNSFMNILDSTSNVRTCPKKISDHEVQIEAAQMTECRDFSAASPREQIFASQGDHTRDVLDHGSLGLTKRLGENQLGPIQQLNFSSPKLVPNSNITIVKSPAALGLANIHYSPLGITFNSPKASIASPITSARDDNPQNLQVSENTHLPSNVRICFPEANSNSILASESVIPEVQFQSHGEEYLSKSDDSSTVLAVGMGDAEKRQRFRRARRKRLNKLRRKREAKEKESRWSAFIMGMNEQRAGNGSSKLLVSKEKDKGDATNSTNQAENVKIAEISLGPQEIWELGKKLGVIVKENEEAILKNLKEMDCFDKSDKDGVDVNTCQ